MARGSVLGRVDGVREEYVAAMQRHREGLIGLARAVGWTCALHLTDSPPQTALLALPADKRLVPVANLAKLPHQVVAAQRPNRASPHILLGR